MKKIKIDAINYSAVAEFDYYGRDGKILLRKGMPIGKSILNALSRRNISHLYVQEEGEDIQKLFQLKELDDMDDDIAFELSIPGEAPVSASVEPPPKKVVFDNSFWEKTFPSLAAMKRGEEGVRQILKSEVVQALENAIENKSIELSVVPKGIPIKEVAQEIAPGSRTQEYKTELVSDYARSLGEVKDLFLRIRNGRTVTAGRITGLVKGFIKTYLNDKHILLNLANERTRDTEYLFSHSLNVSLIAISIGSSRGFDQDQILEVGTGGLLHDIGALFIPEDIRLKKEPLDKDEIFEVQKHPMIGIHFIEKINGLPQIIQFICYQSHERENREGYPKQRGGRLIHDYSKIVSVADIYESLTSERPYRKAMAPYKAMKYLLAAVKNGLLNPSTVKHYLVHTSLFPVGSLVKLDNGEIAKVIKPNGTHYDRPVISVVMDADNRLINEGEIKSYDLTKSHDLKIIQGIDNQKMDIGIMRGL